MNVLFLILKIIGIVLLVLLGILLFLVLSVVFIPVRYHIRGKGEVPEEFESDIVVSWWLHLIHVRIRYGNNGLKYKFRILGIPINFNREKPKDLKTPKTQAEPKPVEHTEKAEESSQNTVSQETESSPRTAPTKPKRTKQSKAKPQRQGWLRQKWQEFKRGFLRLKEQIRNIKSIISDETNQRAVLVLFQELKYLLKHYSPRNASGEVQYGMEDPAQTGQLLGAASIFPFWYRYKISVIPDFETESSYAKGRLSMKGRIRSFHLLVSGVRLIRNTDIRKLINQIRK